MTPCLTIACVDGFKVSTEKPEDPRVVLFLAQVAADHAEAHRETLDRMMTDLMVHGSAAYLLGYTEEQGVTAHHFPWTRMYSDGTTEKA